MNQSLGLAAVAASTMVCAGSALCEPEYLVAARDSIQRYSLDGDYLGDLVAPGTTLPGASQFTLSPDQSTLYVGTFGSGSNVSIFDARTGEYRGNLDDGGPLQAPSVVTFSQTGSLLVSDFVGGAVYEYDPTTNELLGEFFSGGALVNPHEILWTGDGYLVSDYGRNRVLEYGEDGSFERVVFAGTSQGIARPLDMLFSDDMSELYVSNNANGRITVFDMATEELVRTIGVGSLTFPEGLAWAPDGSLIVANAGEGTIVRLDAQSGELLDTFEQIPGVTRGTTDVLLIPSPPAAGAIGLGGLLVLRRRRRRD